MVNEETVQKKSAKGFSSQNPWQIYNNLLPEGVARLHNAATINMAFKLNSSFFFYRCTVYFGIYKVFIHQQMHSLLNLTKF